MLVLSGISIRQGKVQSMYFNSPAIMTEMTYDIYRKPLHEMGSRAFSKLSSCTAHIDAFITLIFMM